MPSDDRLELGRGVQAMATATKLGDFFQYLIDRPVSLPRQKSAMLPIINKDVEATRVSIYNERTQAKFPLLGLKFKNTSGMHLMQGPDHRVRRLLLRRRRSHPRPAAEGRTPDLLCSGPRHRGQSAYRSNPIADTWRSRRSRGSSRPRPRSATNGLTRSPIATNQSGSCCSSIRSAADSASSIASRTRRPRTSTVFR